MDSNNVKNVIIAKNCGRTANVQITDSGNSTTYLGNGEVVIIDPQGNVLTTTTALKSVEYIRIAQRGTTGDIVYMTAPIYGKFIRSYAGENYVPSCEQVINLGYDGTTGDLDADLVADSHYSVRLHAEEFPIMGKYRDKSFGYKSGYSVPSKIDVMAGLGTRIAFDTTGNGNFNINPEVLSDDAGAGIGATGDLVVSNGVREVKAVDADAVLVAGDYLRIGTATTDSVYKVSSISPTTNIITLDRPYTGESALVPAAGAQYITKALANAGAAGLKITALPFYYERFNFPYRKEVVSLQVSELILSSPIVTVNSCRGTGTFEQVSDLEGSSKGIYMGAAQLTHPNMTINFPQDASAIETYDLVSIGFSYKSDHDLANSINHVGDVVLAIANGTNQGFGGTNTIIEVLNKYIVTENGVGTAITLTV